MLYFTLLFSFLFSSLSASGKPDPNISSQSTVRQKNIALKGTHPKILYESQKFKWVHLPSPIQNDILERVLFNEKENIYNKDKDILIGGLQIRNHVLFKKRIEELSLVCKNFYFIIKSPLDGQISLLAKTAYKNFNQLRMSYKKNPGQPIKDLYLEGVSFPSEILTGINFINCNFDKVKFNCIDFTKANFENCSFNKAEFFGTTLDDTTVKNSTFKFATFNPGYQVAMPDPNIIIQKKSALMKQIVSETPYYQRLDETALSLLKRNPALKLEDYLDPREVIIETPQISIGQFKDSIFENCDFTFSRFRFIDISDSTFKNVDFTKSKIIGIKFSRVLFDKFLMNKIDLKNISFNNCTFENGQMNDVNVADTRFTKSNFSDSYFKGGLQINTQFRTCRFFKKESWLFFNNVKILNKDRASVKDFILDEILSDTQLKSQIKQEDEDNERKIQTDIGEKSIDTIQSLYLNTITRLMHTHGEDPSPEKYVRTLNDVIFYIKEQFVKPKKKRLVEKSNFIYELNKIKSHQRKLKIQNNIKLLTAYLEHLRDQEKKDISNFGQQSNFQENHERFIDCFANGELVTTVK